MRKTTIYLTLLLGLTACGDDKKEAESGNDNNQKKEAPTSKDDEVAEGDQANWLYDISPSGLITVTNKNAELDFHVSIEIEGAGLSFSKEFEENEEGFVEARFPQDFGIDDYENPLWDVVDGEIFDCKIKISADDHEITSENGKLPVNKSGSLRPLYSDQVEFEQNPVLPTEVGSKDNKSWITFYADRVGFHYLSASHDGRYQHFVETTDGKIELIQEKVLEEIDCESGSIRMGYTDPQVLDANGDDEMEVYLASVNSCIEDERYVAWAEQRGEILAECAAKVDDDLEDYVKEAKDEIVSENLVNYLKTIFERH